MPTPNAAGVVAAVEEEEEEEEAAEDAAEEEEEGVGGAPALTGRVSDALLAEAEEADASASSNSLSNRPEMKWKSSTLPANALPSAAHQQNKDNAHSISKPGLTEKGVGVSYQQRRQ